MVCPVPTVVPPVIPLSLTEPVTAVAGSVTLLTLMVSVAVVSSPSASRTV